MKERKRILKDIDGNPLPRENGCLFLLKRKRRYCTWARLENENFCVNHLDECAKGKRIACPLDPSHSIYESEKDSHVKICNFNKQRALLVSQPYFVCGLNKGEGDEDGLKLKLKAFSDKEIQNIIISLDSYLDLVGSKPACPVEGDRSDSVGGKERHAVQENAILTHVKSVFGEFQEGMCFIEMGCGKAGLSVAARKTMNPTQKSLHVLVDRGVFQGKKDKHIEQPGLSERIRIDIRDLDLRKVDIIKTYMEQESQPGVAMISKHLCGAATCYSLRCATQSMKPDAVVIALCCHHVCSWQAYVNKEMFTKTLKLTRREFDLMCVLSSWAICGFERSEPVLSEQVQEERRMAGIKCKQLLNHGRLLYLKQCGYESVELIQYTNVTKENILLLASRKEENGLVR